MKAKIGLFISEKRLFLPSFFTGKPNNRHFLQDDNIVDSLGNTQNPQPS